jgi:hypothetical protein
MGEELFRGGRDLSSGNYFSFTSVADLCLNTGAQVFAETIFVFISLMW